MHLYLPNRYNRKMSHSIAFRFSLAEPIVTSNADWSLRRAIVWSLFILFFFFISDDDQTCAQISWGLKLRTSYLAPLAGRWNKSRYVCFRPHIDTSPSLTGSAQIWKGLRFLFAPGPAEETQTFGIAIARPLYYVQRHSGNYWCTMKGGGQQERKMKKLKEYMNGMCWKLLTCVIHAQKKSKTDNSTSSDGKLIYLFFVGGLEKGPMTDQLMSSREAHLDKLIRDAVGSRGIVSQSTHLF